MRNIADWMAINRSETKEIPLLNLFFFRRLMKTAIFIQATQKLAISLTTQTFMMMTLIKLTLLLKTSKM